jgi:hypothetical protein
MSEKSQELDLTPVEGNKPVPAGWRVLFWGLIAFGVYYLWKYSPAFTGWTQSGDLDQPAGGAATSVLATIAFTALAVIVAASLVLVLARREPAAAARRAGR